MDNEENQAGVQFHLAEEPNKSYAVVRDKRKLILGNAFGRFPLRLALQTEVVDVGCFETRS